MNDPWVRGGHGSWIQSPQSQGVHSLRVSDLIVGEERVWDIDKLESLFPDDMVQAILDTPLFAEVQNDKIVWMMERNGRYTVKTGYKLAMMELLHTDRFHVEGEWHRIWNVNSPHKARNLLWRICRGCVPTRLRLQSRHVQCEVICPWCDTDVEDDWHAFVGCTVARESWYWAGLSTVLQPRVGTVSSLADFVFDICRSESRDIAGRVASLLWQIWAARNDVIWNAAHHTSTSIGRTALDAWQQWQEVHKHPPQPVVQHGQNRVQGNSSVWEKPRETWLKCNVDAAFHDRNHITSFACCVRDSRGQFIRAQTKWQRANMTVLEGEAVALLEALHFADANRWDRVVFESDSSTLVQALSSPCQGDSEFYAIVSSIIYQLSLHSNFEVKFVRRQANMVAHSLARAACSWASHRIFDSYPSCIEHWMINDNS